MKLPIVISVPHAGLCVPEEVAHLCQLSPDQIRADSDEGAAEIYSLQDEVEMFVTTGIARTVVDLNRSENDRRPDGIVKTVTCHGDQVWHEDMSEDLIETLLNRYHRPYHHQLSDAPQCLGIDCHTMCAVGPAVAPDPGQERPWICLSDGNGTTLPGGWMALLHECFNAVFGDHVKINTPFGGGYITRHHAHERPWVQLEISRAPFMTNVEKRERVLSAIQMFWDRKS